MPEGVGAADEQAIDKMQVSSKGREKSSSAFYHDHYSFSEICC
jgi:hypothetical protein